MATLSPTIVGRVRQVLGARITVELESDLAGTTPLLEGRPHHVGQIGSMVRIPRGTTDLLATVTMIGISELAGPPEPGYVPSRGNRWLQAQLVGERDGLGRFFRGVSQYPSLDDAVHLTTVDDLQGIYPSAKGHLVRLGRLSSANHDVALDLGKLVFRHSLVVGATGSGKSSTVARIVQNIISAGFREANILVIDPHGEYSQAFTHSATVRSVLSQGEDGLWIPYWALAPEDLITIYAGGHRADSPTVRTRFVQEVLQSRQEFLARASWTAPAPEDVLSDSPVPFDLRELWFRLDYEDRATYATGRGQGAICQVRPGSAEELIGAMFQPYGQGGAAPHQGTLYGAFRTAAESIKARLTDPLYHFLERTRTSEITDDPLPQIMSAWLGDQEPVSILDFSGVPGNASDIAIGAVLTLLFDAATSSAPGSGIGRHRPILVILEEAHRFIGEKSTALLAKTAVERIAREGRKYGFGLMLVTQRPSEISEVVLSQAGTVIAHRLTNSADQSRIESSLPDAVAQLSQILPSLRNGEALVTGEATILPSRVLVDAPNPWPRATDPDIAGWSGEPAQNDLVNAVARMRGQGDAEE